jgi:hypothetical protein
VDLGVAEIDLGFVQLRLRAGDLRRQATARGEVASTDVGLLAGGVFSR